MKPLSDLTDTPCNYLIERAVAQGRIPIAYTCSMVPDALLSVNPLFPVKVRAPSVEGTESADIYLSSVICSYTRSILEYALDGRYDFCRGWIFTASCDHMRRCFDNLEYLRRPEFIHILDVPHKTTPEGIRWLADENISEISCHAMGAFTCNPRIKTIVDIGGQDVKGIALADDGSVREFAMNDKCAAGTGRFFEAMSRVFRMDIESFSELSLKARRIEPVTSQCSVFAETEVIGLLAKRTPPHEVAAGIQAAVAKRCFTLLKRVGVRPLLAVTGGCAKNRGLVKALADVIGMEVASLSVDPQIIGALGAAVFARKRCA